MEAQTVEKYLIDAKEARKLLSRTGWRFVKRGYIWHSRCSKWQVYLCDTAQQLYVKVKLPVK